MVGYDSLHWAAQGSDKFPSIGSTDAIDFFFKNEYCFSLWVKLQDECHREKNDLAVQTMAFTT